MTELPWFIKHKPNKFTEIEISDDTNFRLLKWLKDHSGGGVVALSGGTGVGKTSLVYAISKILKFKIIEYSEVVNNPPKAFYKTLDGLSPLILIDESDFPSFLNIPKFQNIPVIYTTTHHILDPSCIRIPKPNDVSILKSIKKILQKENSFIEDRVILRLARLCNYDFRSCLNYCQLISYNREIKDFNFFEKLVTHTISHICRTIFSKRVCFKELESLYSEKVLNLCLNNLVNKTPETLILKSFESISEIAMYPEKYKFLSLDSINKVRIDFEYIKEDTIIEIGNKKGHRDPIHFLPFYKRNLLNLQSVKHLQEIFKTYKIENLSNIDKEIEEYVDMKAINSKILKYKYHTGSSCAVKRDIAIEELLNL